MSRPTLAPDAPQSGTVHMVLDDHGRSIGRAWREMDENHTDERDVVNEIIDGRYSRPIKVVAFNLDENWARDVNEDIARAIIETSAIEGRLLSSVAVDFIERVTGENAPADLVES